MSLTGPRDGFWAKQAEREAAKAAAERAEAEAAFARRLDALNTRTCDECGTESATWMYGSCRTCFVAWAREQAAVRVGGTKQVSRGTTPVSV